MAKGKRGLGRGLGAFFGDDVVQEAKQEKAGRREAVNGVRDEQTPYVAGDGTQSAGEIASEEDKTKKTGGNGEVYVKLSHIEPNREQPRKEFREEQLQELAESIRQYGVLQPLLVQKRGDYYEIIAGERRWRAAKLAGIKEVPVVIREYSEQETVEIALIENVQREDLNPIEEAVAYQRLVQEFHMKQEEIAERVSKNRATIANSIRLLNLVKPVQQMLIDGQISSGHARALLALENPEKQLALAKQIVDRHMSVRDVEKAVKALQKAEEKEKDPKVAGKKEEDMALALAYKAMEDRMKSAFGTKVSINRKDRKKGKIEIEYYSESELERIVELVESIGTAQ